MHLLLRTVPGSIIRRRLDPGAGRAVLLTFDDGPSPGVTGEVLDRLAAARARAVFFVIGERVRRHPGLAARARREGHLLGNHSHTHSPQDLHSPKRLLAELRGCQAAVREATGEAPRLYRPPRGRLTPAGIAVPPHLGLQTVLWSRDPRDWACRTADAGRRLGTELALTVRGGDIVLLHDEDPSVLALLDALLPGLADRGLDPGAGLDHLGARSAPRRAP